MTESSRKNPLGPTGERVQRNVERIRTQRRLTYREIADQLAAIGRPIPTLGLSRLESGDRRVDADDLVALSVVLDCTPLQLLLTPDATDEPVDLAPEVTVTRKRAWQWATGEEPLQDPRYVTRTDGHRAITFPSLDKMAARRPHHPPEDVPELRSLGEKIKELESAGFTQRQIYSVLQLLKHRSNEQETGNGS